MGLFVEFSVVAIGFGCFSWLLWQSSCFSFQFTVSVCFAKKVSALICSNLSMKVTSKCQFMSFSRFCFTLLLMKHVEVHTYCK